MPYEVRDRYDAPTMVLHWLVALLIVVAFIVVQVADGMPRGPERIATMDLHKSLGVTIFALVLVRMAWRTFHPAPALPSGTPSWMELSAKLGHLALYALMIAVPLSGILMTEAKGREIAVWGLFNLPMVVTPDKTLGHDLEEVHELVGNLLLILAGMHAAVALFHQFVLKDGLLTRMRPGGAR